MASLSLPVRSEPEAQTAHNSPGSDNLPPCTPRACRCHSFGDMSWITEPIFSGFSDVSYLQRSHDLRPVPSTSSSPLPPQIPSSTSVLANLELGISSPGLQYFPELDSPYMNYNVTSHGGSSAGSALVYSNLGIMSDEALDTSWVDTHGSNSINWPSLTPVLRQEEQSPTPARQPRQTRHNNALQDRHRCRPFSQYLGGKICRSSFPDERGLFRHLETVHAPADSLYRCRCKRITGRKDNYRRHLQGCLVVSDSPYRCVCGETAMHKADHENHLDLCRASPTGVWTALEAAGAPSLPTSPNRQRQQRRRRAAHPRR